MTRDEFLKEMDELARWNTAGHEKLEDLENWDSTSMIS